MSKLLVACEFSGTVSDAFARRGWEAWSCYLLPSETPGKHIQGDVLEVLREPWDLVIAHPPCTYLANSGAKHLYLGMKKENGRNEERWAKMREGAEFFRQMFEANSKHIAVENPIMLGAAQEIIGMRQDQVVQPWQFGHGETKATCFYLKNLPLLRPTNIVEGRQGRMHLLPPSKDRWKLRSKTYSGIAEAMAAQWGSHVEESNR